MVLVWNEIRERAIAFAKEFENDTYEKGEAQTFWNDFFRVFGVERRRVAAFELNRQRLGQHHGFVDLFWPGMLLVEHKGAGEDLAKASKQANEYIVNLKERELPRYVIVSDFQRLHLFDYEAENEEDRVFECSLAEFPEHVKKFGFIAGRTAQKFVPEDPVNKKAVGSIEKLYTQLQDTNYIDHELKMFLVRLVYCCFADDTLIWEKDLLRTYLELQTSEDGSDLGPKLAQIFEIINTPIDRRLTTLDEDLKQLPYVDGHLFSETLRLPSFNTSMRETLLDCMSYDWGKVSPAIFGSMFQNIMDEEARHDLGAHYTSEENILKVVNGLFMKDLRMEFETIKNNKNKLQDFQDKLSNLSFLDPACGCGNFLVITYRELRLLEFEVIKLLHKDNHQMAMLNVANFSKLDVDRFHGIELEEFPARIAELALWVTDHQMNRLLGDFYGKYIARLPLHTSPDIKIGNALRIDWNDLFPSSHPSYILGNPPFVAKQDRSDDQKNDMASVFGRLRGAGELDYVTAWYEKTSEYMRDKATQAAFVSTNSIVQGEQVGVLWNHLLKKGIVINFAHRTFRWTNEARGRAGVFCVIIGFGYTEVKMKYIYEYETPSSEPLAIQARHINPYLIDAEDILVLSRRNPIGDVPKAQYGSKTVDGGFLLFTDEEKVSFIREEPGAIKFMKPALGADEFLNGRKRWCLWLSQAQPNELREMPLIIERIESVKKFRESSRKIATQRLASTPTVFGEPRQPNSDFVLIPLTTSETRKYVPMAFFSKDNIVLNSCSAVPDATLFHFGVLTSKMHMVWMRTVCGRLESRYRYSNELAYNNFPWPDVMTDIQRIAIEKAAQSVLDARASHPDATLVELYDPLTIPKDLNDAHNALDRAVDRAYGKRGFATEMDRLQFLFHRYKELISVTKEDHAGK